MSAKRGWRQLVIVGAGGFGREVLEIATRSESVDGWSVIGFLDDDSDAFAHHPELRHLLLGEVSKLKSLLGVAYVLAVGDNAQRRTLQTLITGWGREAGVLIDPSATIGARVTLGNGVIVGPGARLSTDILVGEHAHLDSNVTVGHDSKVGDYARLNPGATVAGNVQIGEGAMIGANAAILQGLEIGENALVGAGAVVTKNLPPSVTVVGVPARILRV